MLFYLQIAECLSYLHGAEQTLHNNVCPSSILINKRGMWKLGGLSFSVKSRDGKVSIVFHDGFYLNSGIARMSISEPVTSMPIDKQIMTWEQFVHKKSTYPTSTLWRGYNWTIISASKVAAIISAI